ncbi:MAG: hypothetical protein ABW128_20640 [Rhizorhabdus sp.]
MPNYRFHVINDIDAPDDEGAEHPNLADAHLKAIDYARDLAAHSVRQGRLNLSHRIDVEDDGGNVLLSVSFGDAIEIAN